MGRQKKGTQDSYSMGMADVIQSIEMWKSGHMNKVAEITGFSYIIMTGALAQWDKKSGHNNEADAVTRWLQGRVSEIVIIQ